MSALGIIVTGVAVVGALIAATAIERARRYMQDYRDAQRKVRHRRQEVFSSTRHAINVVITWVILFGFLVVVAAIAKGAHDG